MPDFFVISKIVPLLVYPFPLVLIALAVVSWWVQPRGPRWALRALVALVWLAGSPWVADLAVGAWEVPRRTLADLPAVSDAALVLGGLSDPVVSTPEHLEFNRAAERLTEAVGLWRAGRVKTLLISSGSGDLLNPAAVEAPGLAAWAVAQGVPADRVLVEDRSRNTYENARLSLGLADDKGLRSVVLITSALHMRRSAAVFGKAGFDRGGRHLILWPVDTQRDLRPFPLNLVPDPGSLANVQAVLKEVVGMVAYAWQGYL